MLAHRVKLSCQSASGSDGLVLFHARVGRAIRPYGDEILSFRIYCPLPPVISLCPG
ncbi:hypothetical protein I603_2723 [Erythrobacter dokdonensis DSW-74]|uniref:Uncharacterized protein n=1 Tax=Erythrobacter dokdonensis DSW-74 TaxID=1300349 RepID=A0A1A7BEM0_9SPHN|nr:hypothetical protein I603_2723 [Erythrobacter dokdonensis DSW-74]